jgi:hypothetical protein
MKTVEVDKITLYYMDRVDPDGNLYRFYMYKDMASEIEYFCTEEAGNMIISTRVGESIEIIPKEIEKIPVRGYRNLVGLWNRKTYGRKGWYRLVYYFKYRPTLCIIESKGMDINGNKKNAVYFFKKDQNVTQHFNLWRMLPNKKAMITNEYAHEIINIIKERFDDIDMVCI